MWWRSLALVLTALVSVIIGVLTSPGTTVVTSAAWPEDLRLDSDGDGVPDSAERAWFASDPDDVDSDDDGLPDGFEARGGLPLGEPTALADDPDGDGLGHGDELRLGTHPLAADSDSDGMPDGAEVAVGRDPRSDESAAADAPPTWLDATARPLGAPDTDRDGLSDWDELTVHFTDPARADSDADLLADASEVLGGTDPNRFTDLAADFDDDGLATGTELRLGTRPESPDSDGDGRGDAEDVPAAELRDGDRDGLPDDFERNSGLDPARRDDPRGDPDGDGASTFAELLHGSDPLDPGKRPAPGDRALLTPPAPDADKDRLPDAAERRRGTDPHKADSDGDLLPDGFEVDGDLDPLIPTDRGGDPDGDGLDNFHEAIHGTRPNEPDSDGDRVNDGDEVAAGSDPGDAADSGIAPPPEAMATLRLDVGDPSGSHSERWNLIVGTIRHQAPEFGVVASGEYRFARHRRYRVTIEHAGSNLSQPDFDYLATIAAIDPLDVLAIDDPDRILGETYDSDPSGREAWLTVSRREEAPASEPAPDEPESDDGATLRWVRPADVGVAPLEGPLERGEAYLLEATFPEAPPGPVTARVGWDVEEPRTVELFSVEGMPATYRSARIMFVDPSDEVAATLPASPVDTSPEDDRGRWKVTHVGDDVGDVPGIGVVDGDPARVTLELRYGGRSFYLWSEEVAAEGAAIRVRFRGELPKPRKPLRRFVGGPLGERPGQGFVLSRLTDRVHATVGGARADVLVSGPFADAITFVGTRAGTRIEGRWQRVDGDGVVLETGAQTWDKADPAIDGVIVVEEQTALSEVGPAYPYPFDNPDGRLSITRRTLVVHGRNLPVNPRDPLRLDALDAPLAYFTGGSRVNDRDDLARAWQKLPEGAARGPDVLIVQARLQAGILPGSQPLSLNGMLARWMLEFGDASGEIRFARARREGEWETTDSVLVREHVFVEIETAGRLPMDTIEVDLAKNGEPANPGGGQPIALTRAGGTRSKVYRGPPLLLHPPGARDASAHPRPDEIALEVAADDRLLVVPHQPERLRVTRPGLARVLATPSALGALWLDALRRAATCKGISVADWKTVGREEADRISHVIVFLLEFRSTKINIRQHAAMLLLRDTFQEMLAGVRKEFAQIRADDGNIRKFFAYMRQYQSDEKLPFNQIEVALPDGAVRPFPWLYSPILFDPHRAELSGSALDDYLLATTKAALDAFIARLDVALARARDAGECNVRELLDITGVGFERVVARLLPRLMRLESEPSRSYWVPDWEARNHVTGIAGLAAAVRAEKELASLDNTMIALSIAALSVGAGAVLGEGILGLVVGLGLDAVDLVFTLATEIPDFLASKREVAFATGAQVICGSERLAQARANEGSWFSLATSVLGSGLGTAFAAYRALSSAEKLAALRRGAGLLDDVRARGVEGLSDQQKLDFESFLINAKARGTDLSQAERGALAWLDEAGEARSVRRFTADAIEGGADPALLRRLEDADARRTIERSIEELGGQKLQPQQVDRMLDAHHHGKPPYDFAALREKHRLLTEPPPAGAGLSPDQANALLRKGIMGNAEVIPASSLPKPQRLELNQLLGKANRTADDNRRVAELWLESERRLRRGAGGDPGLSAVERAVQREMAAGRLTPDEYNDLVRRFDELLWEVKRNGRTFDSPRVKRLYRQANAELEALGLSPETMRALKERWRLGSGKQGSVALFRGESLDAFKPRALDVDRTSPELRRAVQERPYIDPKGKGLRTLPPTGDMQADHILPVTFIQSLPGFWKLSPEGRRIVLHFEDNIQGLPASLNAQKGGRLADEWRKVGDLSFDYYKWLKAKEDEMEVRLARMITCLLQGGSRERCAR